MANPTASFKSQETAASDRHEGDEIQTNKSMKKRDKKELIKSQSKTISQIILEIYDPENCPICLEPIPEDKLAKLENCNH